MRSCGGLLAFERPVGLVVLFSATSANMNEIKRDEGRFYGIPVFTVLRKSRLRRGPGIRISHILIVLSIPALARRNSLLGDHLVAHMASLCPKINMQERVCGCDRGGSTHETLRAVICHGIT